MTAFRSLLLNARAYLRVWAGWLLVLAAAAPLSAQTSLLRQANVQLLQGYPVARMAAGDFNGDGLSDVAGISFEAFPDEYTQEKVLIQLQTSESPPRFVDAQALPASAPQDLLVSDLDSDGDADLAVVQDDATDALAIWINQGGAQRGTPARFQRLALMLPYDLAAQVAAIDVDSNPATPPWLLLVRGFGRDSLLFANQLHLGVPGLTLQQALGHSSAVGVTAADIDDNGYADLLVYGDGCRMWIHQGTGVSPPYAALPEALCGPAGTVYAAAMQAMNPSIGQYGMALAAASGDTWVVVTARPTSGQPSVYGFPLSTSTIGITRAFAFIDADGDGDDDLVAARANEDALLPSERGSPVFRRVGNQFEGSLLTLGSAWSVRSTAFATGTGASLLSAHPLRMASLWQLQAASSVVPTVQFQSTSRGYYPAPTLQSYLMLEPFSVAPQASLHIDAVSNGGGHSQWSEDIGAGLHAVVADAPVTAVAGELWTLNLTEVSPAGAGLIGARSTAQVSIVPASGPASGQCYLEDLYLLVAGLLGTPDHAGASGSLQELDQLRRVRDQRLAATAAGSYYADLYLTLQSDLYAATFADPQFANQLWALKNAWMPAINNWLDGDGQSPVSASMQAELTAALDRFAAHASLRLYDAVQRERRALGLDSLQGRPIADLQLRWERSPLFADRFD